MKRIGYMVLIIIYLFNTISFAMEVDTTVINSLQREKSGKSRMIFTNSLLDGIDELNPKLKTANISYPEVYKPDRPPARKQMSTNLCWDFAIMSNLKTNLCSQYDITDYRSVFFSEEHAVQCIKSIDDLSEESLKYRLHMDRNTTGAFEDMWNYLTRDKYNGVIFNNDLSFTENGNIKSLAELNSYSKAINYYPTEFIAVSNNVLDENRISKIKELIYNHGGIVAQINSNSDYYTNDNETDYYYNFNILENTTDNKFKYPHLVNIYGWDDTVSHFRFSGHSAGNGAFIAKDSSTGKDLYLSYSSVNSYRNLKAISAFKDNSFFDNQYQNYELPYINEYGNKNEFLVNKFSKKSQNFENLTSVSVFLDDVATQFKVYISTTGEFNDLTPVKIKDCVQVDDWYTIGEAGEFVVDLAEPIILTNDNFLVGIELKGGNNYTLFPIEQKYTYTEEDGADYKNKNYYMAPVINSAESYRLSNSNLNYKDINNYTDTGALYGDNKYNISTRAYTKNIDLQAIDVDKLTYPQEDIYNEFRFDNKTITSPIILNQTHKINDNIIVNVNERNSLTYNNFDGEYFYGKAISCLTFNKKMSDALMGSLIMYLDGPAEIYVVAQGSNNATLVLKDSTGQEIDSVIFPNGELTTKGVICSKDAGMVYLGLKEDSNLDLVKIYINPLRTVNSNGNRETYNFSKPPFSNYKINGWFNSITKDSFTTNGNIMGTAYIFNESCSLNGVQYTSSLRLINTPDCKRAYFYAPHNSDIYVTMQADNHTSSDLYINNSWGVNFAKLTGYDTLNTYKFHYDGVGEKLCLNVKNSGVKIYEISVEPHKNINDRLYKEWNFDSPEYYGLGEITEPTTIDGLDIYSAVEFKSSTRNINDIQKTGYAHLSSYAREDYASLGFNVPQNCTIRILARSSNKTNTRQLLVVDDHNYLLDTITVPVDTPQYFDVNYIGNGGKVYLRSADNSLDIYSIEIINGNFTTETYSEFINEAKSLTENDNILSSGAVEINESNKILSGGAVEITVNNDLQNSNVNNSIPLAANDGEAFKYYNQLDDTEKHFYNQLFDIYGNKKYTDNVIYISIPTDIIYSTANVEAYRKTMRNAMTALANEHPEIFWIKLNFSSIIKVIEHNNQKYIKSYGLIIHRNDYVGSVKDIKNYINDVNNKILSVTDEMSASNLRFNADYSKLEYIYNTLKNTIYNKSTLRGYNAYNVIIVGTGNCSGIARAFKMYCDSLGYQNVIIRCNIDNGTKDHLCNLVNLDGCWYLCDITNDINNEKNQYFMVKLPDNYTIKNTTSYKTAVKNFAIPNIEDNNYLYLGDTNLDGILSDEDVEMAMDIALGKVNASEKQLLNADVSGNGIVDTQDVAMIMQKVLNNNYEFGANSYVDAECLNIINNLIQSMIPDA